MPSADAIDIGFRGLNRILASALLSPGESPDTTDADFYNNLIGTLGPRKGRVRVTSYTTYAYLGMGMLAVPWGRFRVFATADGKWHALGIAWPGLSTPTDLSDLTGKDTTETVRFRQYKERVYGTNGKNRVLTCDGSGWTYAGIRKVDFTPTVAIGATATFSHQGSTTAAFGINSPSQFGTGKTKTATPLRNATGASSGAYTYYVTACNSKKLMVLGGRACESLPSSPSNEIIAQNGKAITVGGIPATHEDTQVDSFNIYRNKAGQYDSDLADEDQDFFYVGSVPLGTTSFSDTVPDYRLTGAFRLHFTTNIPPSCKMAELFGDRMFVAGFDPIRTGTVTQVKTISNVALTTNVATISFAAPHGFTAGQSVVIAGLTNSDLNGTYTILATPTTLTFTYTKVHADIISVADSGTATSPSVFVDFSGISMPDGVLGAWFKKDGDSAMYRVTEVVSSTRLKIENVVIGSSTTVGFVGTLAGAGYSVFRKQWEIYFSEQLDVEAWGLEGEAQRNKIEIPGRHAITAMCPFQGSLLVFTHHNIYQISGMGPNRSDVRIMPNPLYRGVGCSGPDALCLVGDTLYFMDPTNGPMMLNGGSPQPVGALLNMDWYDSLTASELAIACMGTDDQYVWVSVPVSGQIQNSKTFRYHIVTQTWWEEKNIVPRVFVREDGASGALNTLYYLQDRWLIDPRSGTVDLVTAIAGTTTSSANAQSVTDSGAAFPTTSGGLEQCYVRLYNATTNVLLWERRIISNTATAVTWSADTTLPGSTEAGQGSEIVGARYEIGNVSWRWTTKAFDGKEPFNAKQSQEMLALFHLKSDTAHIRKNDILDGVVQNRLHIFEAKELLVQMEVGARNFTFAAIIDSRDGAVLRALDVRAQVQEGIVL